MGIGDVRLDRLRSLHRRAVNKRRKFRQRILNVRIAFDSRHVLSAGQRVSYFPAAFHQDRVHNVIGVMLDAAFPQPLKDRPLHCLALTP
jgi:hypothetical protein